MCCPWERVTVGAVLALGVVLWGGGALAAKPEESAGHAGRIRGRVLDGVTGEPLAGAYVGVGDFGDSGGSNYSRHRKQGLFAKTETDGQGRFELEGLCNTEGHRYLDYHPLVVTQGGYVRHDEKVVLTAGGGVPEITVRLRPAGTIRVTVADKSGKPQKGSWLVRLEALDGRRFLHTGQDRHLSSFASSSWMGWPDRRKSLSAEFLFTELAEGEYSVEVIRFEIPLEEKRMPGYGGMVLDPTATRYHGGIEKIRVASGETKAVTIGPTNYQTRVTIHLPELPAELTKNKSHPYLQYPFLVVSGNANLALWDDGKVHSLEDARSGRIYKQALFYGLCQKGSVFSMGNLPPGHYSVFAGPMVCLRGARFEVKKGEETEVRLPPVDFEKGAAHVGVWRFDRRVNLEAKAYTVAELCAFLTKQTEGRPRVTVEGAMADERISFKEKEMYIWDVLEKVYEEKGGRFEEREKDMLVLRRGEK